MLHPGVAKIKCEDCLRFQYDFETGERETCPGPNGRRENVLRPAGCPPPCEKCPKRGPRHERDYVLSEKNRRTLELYYRVRASRGACLSQRERADDVLTSNLATIDRILRGARERRLVERIGVTLARTFGR